MTQLMQVGNTANVPTKQYLCDTISELTDLPQEFGTIALCLEDSNFYICNSSGTYVNITNS